MGLRFPETRGQELGWAGPQPDPRSGQEAAGRGATAGPGRASLRFASWTGRGAVNSLERSHPAAESQLLATAAHCLSTAASPPQGLPPAAGEGRGARRCGLICRRPLPPPCSSPHRPAPGQRERWCASVLTCPWAAFGYVWAVVWLARGALPWPPGMEAEPCGTGGRPVT